MESLRTRIAPTPSGLLHAGNGISFILTWALAKANEGSVLLRIDDLDAERMRPEFVEDIFYTLDWLGLDYEEGPSSVDDFLKNYSQNTRLDLYNDELKKILENHAPLVYACQCSRKDIRELSKNGLYPNICRNKNIDFNQKETAWRILVPNNTEITYKEYLKNTRSIDLTATMGDFVIRQKNGMPTYQLASLVDDLHFNINFIVRGEDLLPSTAAQIFLAQNLRHSDFLNTQFFHHTLLLDTVRKDSKGERVKLSKSFGATSLKAWRESGKSPLELYRMAGTWLGLEVDGLGGVVEGVRKHGAFDLRK